MVTQCVRSAVDNSCQVVVGVGVMEGSSVVRSRAEKRTSTPAVGIFRSLNADPLMRLPKCVGRAVDDSGHVLVRVGERTPVVRLSVDKGISTHTTERLILRPTFEF